MIKKFLKQIINNIIDNNKTTITELQTESNTIIIQGLGEETGKIIGKGGSIIRAIRNLATVVCLKNGIKERPIIKIDE